MICIDRIILFCGPTFILQLKPERLKLKLPPVLRSGIASHREVCEVLLSHAPEPTEDMVIIAVIVAALHICEVVSVEGGEGLVPYCPTCPGNGWLLDALLEGLRGKVGADGDILYDCEPADAHP